MKIQANEKYQNNLSNQSSPDFGSHKQGDDKSRIFKIMKTNCHCHCEHSSKVRVRTTNSQVHNEN